MVRQLVELELCLEPNSLDCYRAARGPIELPREFEKVERQHPLETKLVEQAKHAG